MSRDIYQEVTDRIIALIESGEATGDWQKPWAAAASEGLPVNAVTHRLYRGVNVLSLWSAAVERGYGSNEWATYKQWGSRDCQVMGGEKGEIIVFFKRLQVDDESKDDGEKKSIPLLRYSTVFNAEQIEGYEPPASEGWEDTESGELDDLLAEFIVETGADVVEGGPRAYYDPIADRVRLPDPGRFDDSVARAAVLFHELTHWTGHSTRLDRAEILKGRFGDSAYAAEELVAELGAAFLCGSFRLEPVARQDHAEYVAHWLALLRDDKKAIVTAASKAADAAEFLRPTSLASDQSERVATAAHDRKEP